jgi:hypothetical protein
MPTFTLHIAHAFKPANSSNSNLNYHGNFI